MGAPGASALPVEGLPAAPTWRAEIPDATTPWGPVFANGDVYVPTTTGLIAFPRACGDPCDSRWVTSLREDRTGYQVTASGGFVTAAGERRFHVFDARCAADGAICRPRWSVDGRAMSAHVVGASLVTTFSKAAGIRVAVYPLGCADVCAPTWSRLLRGSYPSYGDPVLAAGSLYVRRGAVVYGVSVGCAHGGECDVSLRVGHVPDATFPAVSAGRVIFGTGRDGGTELAAYPAGCGHDCEPSWTADAGGYVESAPEVAGDLIVTWSKGRVVAFPIACSDPCSPAWIGATKPYAIVHHADEEHVVAVSHFRNPAVYAFPTICSTTCEPTWVRRFADDVEPYGADVDDGRLFLAFTGRILAYDLGTGARSWRGTLDTGAGWWVDVGRRSLVVGLRSTTWGPSRLNGFVAATQP